MDKPYITAKEFEQMRQVTGYLLLVPEQRTTSLPVKVASELADTAAEYAVALFYMPPDEINGALEQFRRESGELPRAILFRDGGKIDSLDDHFGKWWVKHLLQRNVDHN